MRRESRDPLDHRDRRGNPEQLALLARKAQPDHKDLREKLAQSGPLDRRGLQAHRVSRELFQM